MEIVCRELDRYYDKWQADAYALSFLLTRGKKATEDVFFKSMLAFASADYASEEAARDALMLAVLNECEDYYLRKLRRAPKREVLAVNLPFPVTDALWTLLKEPYALKCAAFLKERMGYDANKAAALLHMSPARVEKLYAMKLDLSPLSAVRRGEGEAKEGLDALYLRFAERNVPLENRLRRFRRTVDNLVPWLALLVVALFVAAALYTANVPVPPIE